MPIVFLLPDFLPPVYVACLQIAFLPVTCLPFACLPIACLSSSVVCLPTKSPYLSSQSAFLDDVHLLLPCCRQQF
jgi:hypothetical protein